MMKENLTEEKVKQRWQQMEEMNTIWDQLTERQKGYLDGCMNTVIALAEQKRAEQEKNNKKSRTKLKRSTMTVSRRLTTRIREELR